MSKPIFQLKDVTKTVNAGSPEELNILNHLNLDIHDGDFITILGSNGAGKSTLFNSITGNIVPTSGDIIYKGNRINKMSVVKRTKFLSRVFQDPKLGTAPRMTVAENLLLAEKRGEHRLFNLRGLNKQLPLFKKITAKMNNSLDKRLNTPTGNLSGGQRQALSFLMATIKRPDILLLDEHTAALDPNTSEKLMKITNETIIKENLTCLMITHQLEDALKYGNRLIVLHKGAIAYDFNSEEKKKLSKEDMYKFFNEK
ncbi:ABC transporter, ATP-binding protein [Apilactobacillus ozensis DSM 23829 = JCM 17196]|uniref:ABC transporter, ATP-binding protein n=1 Tax=Apilactobacillus ozensis DSM 23829 = JCM 17196 TaxID=1423781 RepID=A0A0R2ASZ6_9LACO|nr:ATP-binding cassette domain-containing protein [Apilactobacillus ozensis]KRM69839.1 ABC transporter, ATP-binding protein [Apilactobacillus ozensis DSM 23829 = JCM 17196]